MPTLADVQSHQPPHVFLIPPTAFSSSWEFRPTAPIAVGLRLLGEDDGEVALREAARTTVEFLHLAEPGVRVPHDIVMQVQRSRTMAFAVARAICDPNDIFKGHEELPALEDFIDKYFTPDGILFVFEELQVMTVEKSPLSPIPDAKGQRTLAALLRSGAIEKLETGERRAVLRLLGCALEMLHASDPAIDDDSFQEEPDGEDEDPVDYDLTGST